MKINEKLSNINNLLFIESNPCPVKYAAYLLGICEYEIRLPLIKISKQNEENGPSSIDRSLFEIRQFL